jgi:Ras-related GTP-binding protein A/B
LNSCFLLDLWNSQAWSRIVNSLIPNAAILSKHLTTLAEVCGATEVILFERTTFLVVATSAVPPGDLSDEEPLESPTSSQHLSESNSTATLSTIASSEAKSSIRRPATLAERYKLDPARYERTSEIIKAFKHASSRMRSEFRAMEFEFPEFTAVLDELTKNMYVLIIVHDPTIGKNL